MAFIPQILGHIDSVTVGLTYCDVKYESAKKKTLSKKLFPTSKFVGGIISGLFVFDIFFPFVQSPESSNYSPVILSFTMFARSLTQTPPQKFLTYLEALGALFPIFSPPPKDSSAEGW